MLVKDYNNMQNNIYNDDLAHLYLQLGDWFSFGQSQDLPKSIFSIRVTTNYSLVIPVDFFTID